MSLFFPYFPHPASIFARCAQCTPRDYVQYRRAKVLEVMDLQLFFPDCTMLWNVNIDLDTLLLRWFGRIQSCTDCRAALQDGTILISLRSALHPDLPEKSGSQSQNAESCMGSLFLIHSSCLLMILQRWIWSTYPVTICPRMIRAESFTSGYVIRSYTEGSVSQPLQSRWSM